MQNVHAGKTPCNAMPPYYTLTKYPKPHRQHLPPWKEGEAHAQGFVTTLPGINTHDLLKRCLGVGVGPRRHLNGPQLVLDPRQHALAVFRECLLRLVFL